MTLFWHCVFATGFSKLNSGTAMWRQYEMLHAYAMGNFRDLLLQLSKGPGDDLLAGQLRQPRRHAE